MAVRSTRQGAQSWVLDLGLRQGGFDVLHPEGSRTFQSLGYDANDLDEVFDRVQSAPMLPKAFFEVGEQVFKRAVRYEADGYNDTAYSFYLRAALLFSRSQYSIFSLDPRKTAIRERCNRAVDHMRRLRPGTIERVELDFEGEKLYGLLHLPSGEIRNAPAVILSPGMDMTKEDLLAIGQTLYAERGCIALAVDLPGMGETRLNGLTVTLTNPERAISRFIDFLTERPEVDPSRIGLFGMSMSTYWGMRGAAHDTRLRGVAGFMGVYGNFDTIFDAAQPNYKSNFMAMAGYTDEAKFDEELASKMNLWELASKIECPVLMGVGEFDELVSFEETIALFELLRCPREIRVYENQFHPLGGIGGEMPRLGAEFLERALSGQFDGGHDKSYYVRPNGEVLSGPSGSADPQWWLGARPTRIAEITAQYKSASA